MKSAIAISLVLLAFLASSAGALQCAALLFTGPGCGACLALCLSTLGVGGLIPGVCAAAFAAPTP